MTRRPEFVTGFLDIGTGYAAVDKDTSALVGLIIVRPCEEGFRAGPLRGFRTDRSEVDELYPCRGEL